MLFIVCLLSDQDLFADTEGKVKIILILPMPDLRQRLLVNYWALLITWVPVWKRMTFIQCTCPIFMNMYDNKGTSMTVTHV